MKKAEVDESVSAEERAETMAPALELAAPRAYRVRGEVNLAWRAAMAGLCIASILALWWVATLGAPEERLLNPTIMGSPAEVFGSFKELWFDWALTRSLFKSLGRVIKGFGLALALGIPLGVFAGVFPRLRAFLAPITIAGRNVPVAALIPLTIVWFGIGESQKVMFLFIASVAFVVFDTTETIMAVEQKYVDTAYTLGASRWQVVSKVLVPLAMPDIFNSMRLLLGLAFGYIILAEIVNIQGGLGAIILVAQRRAKSNIVVLALFAIALIAFSIDRLIHALGAYLFPYRQERR